MTKRFIEPDLSAPIIIGGVGGSGTRVVTMLLQSIGVYMGGYKNKELDSGFFGRLIASYPHLSQSTDHEIFKRLEVFTKLHLGTGLSLTLLRDIYHLIPGPKRQQLWLHLRRAYYDRIPVKRVYSHWGFKHPSSYLYLNQLSQQFPSMHYIHVTRHGLDMAFSANNHEILNWGKNFDIEIRNLEITYTQKFDYWLRANTWTLDQCQKYIPDRHYILNYDLLCSSPETEIQHLFHFLNISPQMDIRQLSEQVIPAGSTGRYKDKLDFFTSAQIEAVRNWGFEVSDH